MRNTILKLLMMFYIISGISISGYSQNNVSTLKFDGVNDYVRYASDATLEMINNSSNFTFEAWVKISSNASTGSNIYRRTNQFVIYFNSNNRLSIGIYNNGDYRYYHSTDGALGTDEWHHIAIIRNTSLANYLHFYVDGVDVTALDRNGYALASVTNNLYIGNNGNGGSYIEAKIDEIRIKNVAEDIANLSYDKNDPEYSSDANTAALFHFNENNGYYTENFASNVDARLGDSAEGDSAEPQWATFDDLWFPIQLASFTASVNENEVVLDWTTLSETNNKGFEIQRSIDTKNWEVLGFVDGQGDSRDEVNYNFVDNSPKRNNFYRLSQIDFDGKVTYSNVVSVSLDRESKVSVFPNPTKSFLNIAGLNTNSDFVIYDKLGKTVKSGSTSGNIDIYDLSEGVYYLRINDLTYKIIKK